MLAKEEISAALGKGLTQTQLDALHNARVAVVGRLNTSWHRSALSL